MGGNINVRPLAEQKRKKEEKEKGENEGNYLIENNC